MMLYDALLFIFILYNCITADALMVLVDVFLSGVAVAQGAD